MCVHICQKPFNIILIIFIFIILITAIIIIKKPPSKSKTAGFSNAERSYQCLVANTILNYKNTEISEGRRRSRPVVPLQPPTTMPPLPPTPPSTPPRSNTSRRNSKSKAFSD